MENTLENKAKFFSQYWGQKCLHINSKNIVLPNYLSTGLVKENILQLKPISSITNEDAMFINSLNEWNYELYEVQSVKNIIINGVIYNLGAVKIYDYDYLRSKGYALPFMGSSVEQLIEYGWIKLSIIDKVINELNK